MLKQIAEERCEVENQYGRMVPESGNRRALAAIAEVFDRHRLHAGDAAWLVDGFQRGSLRGLFQLWSSQSGRGGSRMTARLHDTYVNLSHGSGGRAMRTLIEDVFLEAFGHAQPDDSAVVPIWELAAHGDRLAFTTDSYVVNPLFFPGEDIDALAVAGTLNDLAIIGAQSLFLSCGMVLEGGLPTETLRRAAASMSQAIAAR